MKRIVLLLLIIAILMPMGLTVAANSKDVNYARGLKWDKKVGGPTVVMTEDGAIMSDINYPWDSVGCDILPALKDALGEKESVTVKLTVEIKAALKDGNQSGGVCLHPLIRGSGSYAATGDADWNREYESTLGGDAPLFSMSGSNIMMSLSSEILSIPSGAWVTYEKVMKLTHNQVMCPILSEWMLCVDGIEPTGGLESVEMRNLSICIEENRFAGDDVWNGDIPQPKDEYTAQVWSPAEIILHSTIDYDNPYTATEIDAVFTHTDGTQITLPGFWMGGRVWAVRFSPTKTGEWSYSVSCKDPENTGLNATGRVIATETDSSTELSAHGFVTTLKDQRYYQYADGTPFFWLGDTNWQAPTQVSTTVCNYPGCDCGSQFKHIVNDRLEKGFTVYQTYFVPEGGNGERGLWLDAGHREPDVALFNEKIDGMFEYLGQQGMVIALGLGCHSSTMNMMKLDDFLRFTRYIVARYACYSIVWITGQEITDTGASATPGYSVFDCYMEAAATVERLDGYNHPNSAHMYPMYATDERAVRLDTSDWHDSWTVQGGHVNENGFATGRSKSYYESYYNAAGSGYHKTFIEAEANYEEINCGPFTGYESNRIGAWRAMLCGSAGFTYGVTGVWACCFSTSTFTGWYDGMSSYSYEPWYMGIGKPGSYEVSYMKQFFLDIGPWQELVPRFDDTSYGSRINSEKILLASTEDASVAVVYLYGLRKTQKLGTVEKLDDTKTYDVYWFDTRTGRYIPVEKDVKTSGGTYTLPQLPTQQDWVLLITSVGLDEHYEESLPTDLNPEYTALPTGTPVTPEKVTAVGGITYEGYEKASQTMTDHTLRLYDGDPTTVWTPSANRTTQTFLFDLGKAQKLTHITITPATGTVIPHFRVYGSNDGVLWTVITDTSLREAEYSGVGSEPLQGVYRYVRVLLLNAETVFDDVTYETVNNPMTHETYSVTKITDIQICSDGEGTPLPEVKVESSLYKTDEDVDNTEEVVKPDNGSVSDTDSDGLDNDRYYVLGAAVAVLAVAAVGVILLIKRRKGK